MVLMTEDLPKGGQYGKKEPEQGDLFHISIHIADKQKIWNDIQNYWASCIPLNKSTLYRYPRQKDWNLGKTNNQEILELPLSCANREKMPATHHLFDQKRILGKVLEFS